MSRPHDILFDRHFREARQRIKEQEARLHRMIVQGFPSQSVADTLRAMQAALRQSEKERRIVR